MHDDIGVLELLDLEAQSGEEEAVARRQDRGEAFLDRAEPAAVLEADGHQRLLDDDAGIQAVLLGDARLGDAPHAAGLGHQPAEAVVGFERIAASGDEIEDFLEGFGLETGVRRGRADFAEQFLLLQRRGDRHRENVLGKHVERAGAEGLGVELAVVDRV
jgi:hypothetical protein